MADVLEGIVADASPNEREFFSAKMQSKKVSHRCTFCTFSRSQPSHHLEDKAVVDAQALQWVCKLEVRI